MDECKPLLLHSLVKTFLDHLIIFSLQNFTLALYQLIQLKIPLHERRCKFSKANRVLKALVYINKLGDSKQFLKHSEHLGVLILLFCAGLKLIRNACTIIDIICDTSTGCKNHVCSMGLSYPVFSSYFHQTLLSLTLFS